MTSERATILITGAGGGGAHNLVSTVRERERYRFVGTDIDRFKAARAPTERAYVVPRADDPRYVESINAIAEKESVRLVVPTNDAEVEALSAARERLRCGLFFPPHETVSLCLDKWRFHEAATAKGVPVARTYPVRSLDDVEPIFQELGRPLLWCRTRRGAGARGATQVKDPEQARWWIRYWNEMRGVPVSDFTISEFLPGRDFACQSTWRRGELVLIKAAERLSYIEAAGRPSNMSSSPELARTVDDPRVYDACIHAVGQLDGAHANGNYCIDLKEDDRGEPRLTEVNIGRFFMIGNLFNRSGAHSMADAYLQIALGADPGIQSPYDFEECHLVRSIDTLPTILRPEEIDARVGRVAD